MAAVLARWVTVALLLGGMALAGCGEVPKTSADASGGGGDGAGSGSCEASKALRCEGTTLVSCNAEGTAEVQTQCAIRCNMSSLACEDKVNPSNGFASQLDAATGEPAINLTQARTDIYTPSDFNATAGTLKVGSQQVKAALVVGTNGSPDVIVISVSSLSVASGATLYVQGSNALAIMSAGDVSIAGTMIVTSGATGGNDPCIGASPTAVGADNDFPGGGGGGFGQQGATGGSILTTGNGGAGGSTNGNEMLVPLRGGCPGGLQPFTLRGAGGGAIQIASATRIDVPGRLAAPGDGGTGASGGGSGGGVLLEAPVVSITSSGAVTANGGGGGCGTADVYGAGSLGATPGPAAVCGSVKGGVGGTGSTPPTSGDSLVNSSGVQQNAAGGGGGVGRIRINTLDKTVSGSGVQSPAASLGTIGSR